MSRHFIFPREGMPRSLSHSWQARVDFWRASAAAPAWFEGPSIVILERAYKITMTFDVRGAAAGADHGGTGLRTRPRSARRAGWTRDAPTPATVSPMRRESLELGADTAPSSAARCRMASSDIAVMLLLFSSRPWRPGSSIGRTPSGLRLVGRRVRGLCGVRCVRSSRVGGLLLGCRSFLEQ